MTTADGSDGFYGSIPVFRGFSSLMNPALYSPLPDDWSIGVDDIVESTKAIAEARYKAVNMAGASVIAAVANALEGREFPFVFGGDGASFAVAPQDLERAREALAATAIWVQESLNLVLRVALVPVAAVAAEGFDGWFDQPGQVVVVDGALGDVDHRPTAVQLAPPARRNEVACRLCVHRPHEPDVRRQVATGVLEAGHRRHDQAVGQHADVEQEHR